MPWSITQHSSQDRYLHVAILDENTVIAYGQLVYKGDRVCQIRQMVVQSGYQGRGLGKKILLFLIEQSKQREAIAITLNARLTAIGFYQKLGFKTYGIPFPSRTTGVMHIAMNRRL